MDLEVSTYKQVARRTLFNETLLANFINFAENLQHLTITGDGWWESEYGRCHSLKLAGYKGISRFYEALRLKHLTHFTLQNAVIDPAASCIGS